MFYECYDKNGNYIGRARTKTEANMMTEQANLRLMKKEGVSSLHRAMYSVKMKEKRKKEENNQAIGFKIFLFFIAISLLLSLIGSLMS